ncbi:hypothetical protein DASB73_010700 [Starmerella bacillaris]|uniref:Uncharacterized protein n=1 Tax=Starmerella bacillaris TaxID=1247836 RepID=A0AAV5RG98_STABA|nr:hypothetical protein DASB73_010700 [Starmerella bacillaris]
MELPNWEDWFRTYSANDVRRKIHAADIETQKAVNALRKEIGNSSPQFLNLSDRLESISSMSSLQTEMVHKLSFNHISTQQLSLNAAAESLLGLGQNEIRQLVLDELKYVVTHAILQKKYLRAARIIYLGQNLGLDVEVLDKKLHNALIKHIEAGFVFTPDLFSACLISFNSCASEFTKQYLDICTQFITKRLQSFDTKAFETVDRTVFIYNSIAFDLAQSRLSQRNIMETPEITCSIKLVELVALLDANTSDIYAFPPNCFGKEQGNETSQMPSIDLFLEKIANEVRTASANKFSASASVSELTTVLSLFVRQVQHALNDVSVVPLLLASEDAFVDAFLKLTENSVILQSNEATNTKFQPEDVQKWLKAVNLMLHDLDELENLARTTRNISKQFSSSLQKLKTDAELVIADGISKMYVSAREKRMSVDDINSMSLEEIAEIVSAIGTLDNAAKCLHIDVHAEPVALYRALIDKLKEKLDSNQSNRKPTFGGKSFMAFDFLNLLDSVLDKNLWTDAFVKEIPIQCCIPSNSRLIFEPLDCDGPEELNYYDELNSEPVLEEDDQVEEENIAMEIVISNDDAKAEGALPQDEVEPVDNNQSSESGLTEEIEHEKVDDSKEKLKDSTIIIEETSGSQNDSPSLIATEKVIVESEDQNKSSVVENVNTESNDNIESSESLNPEEVVEVVEIESESEKQLDTNNNIPNNENGEKDNSEPATEAVDKEKEAKTETETEGSAAEGPEKEKKTDIPASTEEPADENTPQIDALTEKSTQISVGSSKDAETEESAPSSDLVEQTVESDHTEIVEPVESEPTETVEAVEVVEPVESESSPIETDSKAVKPVSPQPDSDSIEPVESESKPLEVVDVVEPESKIVESELSSGEPAEPKSKPVEPVEPVESVEPVETTIAVEPQVTEPEPVEPVTEAEPVDPVEPVETAAAVEPQVAEPEPVERTVPTEPVEPANEETKPSNVKKSKNAKKSKKKTTKKKGHR